MSAAKAAKAQERLKALEERLAERRKGDSTSGGGDDLDDDGATAANERTRAGSSGSDAAATGPHDSGSKSAQYKDGAKVVNMRWISHFP